MIGDIISWSAEADGIEIEAADEFRILSRSFSSGCSVMTKKAQKLRTIEATIPGVVADITIDLANRLEGAIKRTDIGFALTLSQDIENRLGELLQSYMPNLSRKIKDRLFGGYGSFSTFESRVETAYAFGLINGDMKAHLNALRAVRNGFAHTTNINLQFDDNELDKRFEKLGFSNEKKRRELFTEAVLIAQMYLKDRISEIKSNPDKRASEPKATT